LAESLPKRLLSKVWMAGIMGNPGLAAMDVANDMCLKASELPPMNGGPCDQFIIATALRRNAPAVTADGRFDQYGGEVLIWAAGFVGGYGCFGSSAATGQTSTQARQSPQGGVAPGETL